jgi:competence protein ComEC
LPYLLYEIGRLSLIAPVSNLVILPLIPPIMLLCFVIGILGWIHILLIPISGALYLLSMFVIKAAHLFAHLPFAAFNLRISLIAMIVIYAVYFTAGYFTASSKRRPETS